MRILSFVFLFVFALNISAQSTKVDTLLSEGTRHANAGRFDAALKSYKTALSVAETKYAGNEYRARLHYNIGVCYFQLGQFKFAENEFKSAVLLKTDFARAHYALGMAEARRRKWKTADSVGSVVSVPGR